jgi:glutathione S-transferase
VGAGGVGQLYQVRVVAWQQFEDDTHRAPNPFGQIPTYEEGDLMLFESYAIVFQIAERFAGLFPPHPNARARAIMWMFAALSAAEPPIVDRDTVEHFEDGKSWQRQHFAKVDARIRERLDQLA